jgi:hypothetical protein
MKQYGCFERRKTMATESFGKIVYLDNDMADKIIAAQERMRTNPPKLNTHQTKWASLDDSKKLTEALKKKYGYEK